MVTKIPVEKGIKEEREEKVLDAFPPAIGEKCMII